MKIKRCSIIRLFLAFSFTYFTLYQTIDRYGDTYKAVSEQIQILSQKNPQPLFQPSPEEDTDAFMPLMLGRVLLPSATGLINFSQTAYRLIDAQLLSRMASPLVHPHGRSPPSQTDPQPFHSLLLSRSPLHILAPPLA